MKDYIPKIEEYLEQVYLWGKNLSERTLSLAAIAILYLTFLPDLVAYLNRLTDQLPSLNSYLIVMAALVVMNLRAIFKRDSISCLVHLIGFMSQIGVISFILLK